MHISNKVDFSIITSSYKLCIDDLIIYFKKLLKHIEEVNQYTGNIIFVLEKEEKYIKKFLEVEFVPYDFPLFIIINNTKTKGFASCLNYGIKYSNADYIIRSDPDDDFLPGKIYSQISTMKSTNSDISFTAIKTKYGISRYTDDYYKMLLSISLGFNPIAHPTTVYKRDIFGREPIYDNSLNFAEDFDLWIKALIYDKKFCYIDRPYTYYSIFATSKKVKYNALAQIKIRKKYIIKLFYLIISLTIGVLFSFLRLFIPLHHLSFKAIRKLFTKLFI